MKNKLKVVAFMLLATVISFGSCSKYETLENKNNGVESIETPVTPNSKLAIYGHCNLVQNNQVIQVPQFSVVCFENTGNRFRCNGSGWDRYYGPAECDYTYDGSVEEPNVYIPPKKY